MTWGNRIRLLLGLVVVVAIVAVCTIVFTQRQSRAQSTSASIQAQSYSVGASYAGTVTAQLAEPGDRVTAGDPLFEIRSPQLVRDLEAEVIDPGDLDGVDVDAGTFQVTATVDGTVAEVFAPVGDFAPSGVVLARIERAGTMTVEAEFVLTARDYGRVSPGARVDLLLPDDATLVGTVDAIEIETVDGRATSTVTVECAALRSAEIGGLYRPGTPVTATLHLRDDGPLAGVADALHDFVRKLGL